ncbi:oxygenase [Lithospermum erythrorhizon]|uniref:Oxygenase n=1 Tax=Lithospermum erythrorhizon TaxID=34254 RepID=A0AAV3QLE1_LITER
MDLLHTIFYLISSTLFVSFIAIITLALKIFLGKSIKNKNYPPVLGTVFHQLLYFNNLYEYQTQTAKKYHTYRLLSPEQSEIYTTDVRNIEHVLKHNFDKYSKGKKNQDIATDLFGEGIFIVDGDQWKKQRKLSSYEFSTRVLRDFSCTIFRQNAARLAKLINEFSLVNQEFDIQELLMKGSLDSIFKVGFGVDLNCLEGSSQKGVEFIKAFDDSNELTYWRYVDPFWKLKKYLNIGCEASLKKNIGVMHNFVDEFIQNKRNQLEMQQESNDKEDILSRFLMDSKKNPEVMTDKYLRDIILNFIIAGKDTTANTLSWFFYLLSKHPIMQERILEEMREVMVGYKWNQMMIIEDFVESITEEVLEKMHYLHAALTETLRLYPAVPVDGRCAEADDILPDGHKLRKGDGVYYMAYAMGRMPYIWGDDAEEFKPERWLKDGIFQQESPFKFIAFHAGPRTCLGKDFAYRQMKIVSIALLYLFRLRLATNPNEVTYRTMFTLQIKGGLRLLAASREQKGSCSPHLNKNKAN